MISLAVSLLALSVSAFTAWATLVKRGSVLMTQPTTVYFGPDGGAHSHFKVFFRTLLYATAKRGCIVESLFIRLSRMDRDTSRLFMIWVYGDDALRRGSGLFIPEGGLTANHHFLLPFDRSSFDVLSGWYTLEVYCSIVGEKRSRLLRSIHLEVSERESKALTDSDNGLYFDWNPEFKGYRSHIRPLREAENTRRWN